MNRLYNILYKLGLSKHSVSYKTLYLENEKYIDSLKTKVKEQQTFIDSYLHSEDDVNPNKKETATPKKKTRRRKATKK